MAALAYVLLPVSGLFAYLKGSSQRVRFHGLQAVAFGLLWPLALYACTYAGPGVTQAGWAAGALIWVALILATAFGANPRVPGLGGALWRAGAHDPRRADGNAHEVEEDRATDEA
jgi:uncharacterized membrane protein